MKRSFTLDPFHTTTNTLLHLFTVPLSIIYSLFTLAIMMQMLFFEVVVRKMLEEFIRYSFR